MASSKVRANQNNRKGCTQTQLTICNRKPPILLFHFELALSLHRRIVLVFVHLVLLFTRLNLGVNFRLLGWRGRRHDYEWFGNVWVLGLGDKDWGVFRSAGKTTSDLSAWGATDSGQPNKNRKIGRGVGIGRVRTASQQRASAKRGIWQ